MKNQKAYTFALILYKDAENYDYKKVIKIIEKNWTMYAYIEHIKDEEVKKNHIHVLVHFNNKRYPSAIAKELDIPSNYIQKANLIPYLRYLIHLDDEDKKQYSIDEVKGPLKERLKEIMNSSNLTESQQVAFICSFIWESTEWLTITTLTQYVIQNGCYSAYRRNFSLFKELILEHNQYV